MGGRFQIPQFQGLIIRTGKRPAGIGRNGHRLDLTRVADEPGPGFGIQGIEPEFPILAARQDALTVRCEGVRTVPIPIVFSPCDRAQSSPSPFNMQFVVIVIWPAALNREREFTHAFLRPLDFRIWQPSGRTLQFPQIEAVFERSTIIDRGVVSGLSPTDKTPVLGKGDSMDCPTLSLEP